MQQLWFAIKNIPIQLRAELSGLCHSEHFKAYVVFYAPPPTPEYAMRAHINVDNYCERYTYTPFNCRLVSTHARRLPAHKHFYENFINFIVPTKLSPAKHRLPKIYIR